MPKSNYLPPWVIQGTGLLAFTFFVGFWAFTGRIEPTLLAFAGTMVGLGLYQGAKRSLTEPDQPPPPPPIAVEEGNGA